MTINLNSTDVSVEKTKSIELDLLISTLYQPSNDYSLSEFGFFLIDDDWDEQSLLTLKNESAVEFLFALQTTDKRIDKLDVIDGIIICEPDQVQQMIKVTEAIIPSPAMVGGVDYADIKRTLQFDKPAHFIQSCILDMDKLDRAQKAVTQLLSQIPKDIIIKNMIVRIKSDCDISLDEMSIIADAVENRVNEDEESYKDVWYGIDVIDKPECCWIEAIYMVD